MAEHHQDNLADGSLLAAIDLGSNSFHLIVAKVEHGELRPVEALAEKVQLGAGLENERLSDAAIGRGLECLTRFAELLESVEPERIRVVGTNALRVAQNRHAFTAPARRILGTRVDVIYGREEARLVYLGVAHTLADDMASRLVIDIGGGSTELIIGEKFEPQRLESLQMGCVSYAKSCFKSGKISRSHYRKAYDKARLLLAPIRADFHAKHWQDCVGSSGTLRAIEALVSAQGWCDSGIDRRALTKLEDKLLKFKKMEDIDLPELVPQRRNVIVPGVAIISALFDALGIEHMRTSGGALREGVIYDLMGRLSHEDVRERSITALMLRYSVDEDIVQIVERRARVFFTATRAPWELSSSDWELLRWAAYTHEIGRAIAHKHFNRHSAYVLRNADLPGFSQEEQEQLAVLVWAQRGKTHREWYADIPETDVKRVQRLIAIMRLAVCFKHVEKLERLPDFALQAGSHSLTFVFPPDWLDEHPMTARELAAEQDVMAKMGLKLKLD
ncbi:MAG: Ppx/GppA phosphatase family protein [Pseudomonadota bacterium]